MPQLNRRNLLNRQLEVNISGVRRIAHEHCVVDDSVRLPPSAVQRERVLVLGDSQTPVHFDDADFGEKRLLNVVHEVHAESGRGDQL